MAGVQTFGNFIGGEWVPAESGGTFENRNPANSDDLIGRFAASSSEDVDAAVSAAAEAFPAWRGMSPIARANILYKASEILAARVNEIGAELTREEGKTLKEGIGETTRAMQILRYFAGEAQQPTGEHYPSNNPQTLLYTVREPLGCLRDGHALELPDRDSGLEDRAGAGLRQHGRAQAGQPDAALRGPADRGRWPRRGSRRASSTWSPGRPRTSAIRWCGIRGWSRSRSRGRTRSATS